jgi:hypothetical protein
MTKLSSLNCKWVTEFLEKFTQFTHYEYAYFVNNCESIELDERFIKGFIKRLTNPLFPPASASF